MAESSAVLIKRVDKANRESEEMIVGAIGEVVFEVSQLKVLTFDGYRRKAGAKYATHEIINRPAVLEYLHRELEEISLTVKAMMNLGVNPEELSLQLREMCEVGEPNYLILNDVVYGENEYVITSVNERVQMWHGGTVYANSLELTLKEYVGRGD